jgi:hypothetical protein
MIKKNGAVKMAKAVVVLVSTHHLILDGISKHSCNIYLIQTAKLYAI